MKKTFNGLIKESSNWYEIMIGDDSITQSVIEDVLNEEDKAEGMLKVSYFISNSPIDPATAVEQMLLTFYEGRSELDATYNWGSSWTGIYGREDKFEVSGHDIVEELLTHKGKYCLLTVEIK